MMMMLIVMHWINVIWMMMMITMMRQHHLLLNGGGEGNVSDLHHQDGWASARESSTISNNNEPLGESVDYYYNNDNVDDYDVMIIMQWWWVWRELLNKRLGVSIWQNNLLPCRIVWKKVAYLRPKVGAIDRGEWGDQDALGLRFVRWLEGKICTISCFWYATRGVHWKYHITIFLLTAFEIDYNSLGWGKYNI